MNHPSIPVPPEVSRQPQPQTAGNGIAIVMNAGSGAGDKDERRKQVESALQELGVKADFFIADATGPVSAVCQRAGQHAKERGGILVAAGGDGTVNAAAAVCRELNVPLGIIPLGTFNYFARLHGIPLELAEAARVLVSGVARPVAAGEVNGRLFLNNASFGLYTHLIHKREEAKARFGRYRLVALLSGLSTMLRGQRPFAVRLVSGDAASVQRTSMIFVANNPLHLKALELDMEGCTRAGSLGVLMLRPTRMRDRLRLLLRSALKDLDRDHRFESFCIESFEVESARRTIDMVVDGEIIGVRTPLAFRALPEALRLMMPASAPLAAS